MAAVRIGVEVGAFEEHVDRLPGTTGDLAAHDAAKGFRFLLVGDDCHLVVEFVLLSVEGEEFLALSGQPDVNVAMDLVGIEDMQRPAMGHGEQVGDVDQRRDGPETDGEQLLLQPVGARAVL